MKWFRFYDEVLDDPKCQRLSPVMFRHWVNLLCIANRANDRGTLPPLADIAFSLRLTEGKTKAILRELESVGLLDCNGNETYSPHGWKQRQRVSDDVAKRVADHRNKTVTETEMKQSVKRKSNVTSNDSVTLPHVRATDTDTDTDTEQGVPPSPPKAREKPGPAYSAAFETFWKAYPSGHGVKKSTWDQWQALRPAPETIADIHRGLAAWKQSDRWQRGFVKDAQRWIRERCWESSPPPPPEAIMADDGPPRPTNRNRTSAAFDEVLAEITGELLHEDIDESGVIDAESRITG